MKKGLFLLVFFLMIFVVSTKQVCAYSQKTIYTRNNYILSAGSENVAYVTNDDYKSYKNIYVTIDVKTVTKPGKTNFRMDESIGISTITTGNTDIDIKGMACILAKLGTARTETYMIWNNSINNVGWTGTLKYLART